MNLIETITALFLLQSQLFHNNNVFAKTHSNLRNGSQEVQHRKQQQQQDNNFASLTTFTHFIEYMIKTLIPCQDIRDDDIVLPDTDTFDVTDDYFTMQSTTTTNKNNGEQALLVILENELLQNDVIINNNQGDSNSNRNDYRVRAVSGAISGSVWQSMNGDVVYIPPADFEGVDQFTYECRYYLGEAYIVIGTATVHITVESDSNDEDSSDSNSDSSDSNDGEEEIVVNDDEYTLYQNTQLFVNASEGILANDEYYDKNISSLEVQGCEDEEEEGILTMNSNGSFTYEPPINFSGNVDFECTIVDSSTSLSKTSHLSFLIIEPTSFILNALDDSFILQEDIPEIIDVLRNDSYPLLDNVNVEVTNTTLPSHGNLINLGFGRFEYHPDLNWHGVDTFEYELSLIIPGEEEDEEGEILLTSTATVTVTVNGIPHAMTNNFQVISNSNGRFISSESLVENDFDPDLDEIQIDHCDSVSEENGSISISRLGRGYVYTPRRNFMGEDSFTCVISDGRGGFDTKVVNILVTGII